MSYVCPVCNGLSELNYICPNCQQKTEDFGRFGDFFGPYSPYRQIDDLRLTNGIVDDAKLHQCVHLTFCPVCNGTFHAAVNEQFARPVTTTDGN